MAGDKLPGRLHHGSHDQDLVFAFVYGGVRFWQACSAYNSSTLMLTLVGSNGESAGMQGQVVICRLFISRRHHFLP